MNSCLSTNLSMNFSENLHFLSEIIIQKLHKSYGIDILNDYKNIKFYTYNVRFMLHGSAHIKQ
jgi:hypothetical protein